MGKERSETDGRLADAAAGFLEYIGCPVMEGRDGVRRVTLRKRIRNIKPLAVEFGDKPVIDGALAVRVLRMAVDNGGWTIVPATLSLSDAELLDICRRHAVNLGLPVDGGPDAPMIAREPGRMLLACVIASHVAHTRRDRIYAFASHEGGETVRVGWGTVLKALEAGAFGWLERGETRPDPAQGLPEAWMSEAFTAIRRRADSLARRDLWLFGKLQRDLLAEEERLLRLHYSELSNEFLEPLRRLHMRISEANERRNQARSMKSAQAGAAELRKLKGLAGEEEARLRESRRELQDELADQLIEAKRRYSMGSRITPAVVSLVTYEAPVLRLPGMSLRFNPFTGAPSALVWGGGTIRLQSGVGLRLCEKVHPFADSDATTCGCGAVLCPTCRHSDSEAGTCGICGDPVCADCMPVCPPCARESRLGARSLETE